MLIIRNLNLIGFQSWTICGRDAVFDGYKYRFWKLFVEVSVLHIVYFHVRELELLFTHRYFVFKQSFVELQFPFSLT